MSAASEYIDPHQLLDCDDLARLFKVSRNWVEEKVAGESIPFTRIGPRLVRFSRDDVEQIINAGKQPAVYARMGRPATLRVIAEAVVASPARRGA